MRRNARLTLTLLAAAWMPAATVAAEPKTWELGGRGRWAQVEQPSTQAVGNPALDRVEQLLDANQPDAALDAVLTWIKNPVNQAARDRDRARWLLSDAYLKTGDPVRAFYHCDELLDLYPESRYFGAALEKQYKIADMFLSGYKRKLLGIPLLNVDDEGIDMLFRIQERSPGSPLAERALRRTADFYFADGQFDLAFDAYAAYARSYPRSPTLDRVRLRQALSSLAQFRGVNHDATPLIDARAQFEDIKGRFPELAREEGVEKFIETINQTLARKLLSTADFYRRTSKPVAAAYTLQTLVATYPQTPQAAEAKRALAALPKAAVESAGNARRSEPTTQPIGPQLPAELQGRRPGGSRRGGERLLGRVWSRGSHGSNGRMTSLFRVLDDLPGLASRRGLCPRVPLVPSSSCSGALDLRLQETRGTAPRVRRRNRSCAES
jgi:outer membrane assembly lipoprotein YfiO